MNTFSFSGIDGAGKSTQIAALKAFVEGSGLNVTCLEFWDHVVVLSSLRESASHTVFKGDKGVGSPENPLHRRDKNVKSLPLTAMRLFFYLGDSLSLCWIVRRLRMQKEGFVIFDRYIYDELANLPLNNWFIRGFVRLVLKLVPKPDAAFLIDAQPEAARTRKPEYPLDFIRQNRESYLRLAKLAGMTVVEGPSIEEAEAKVRQAVLSKMRQLAPNLSVVATPE